MAEERNSILYLIAGTEIGGSEMLTLNIARNINSGSLDLHIIATKEGPLVTEFESTSVPFTIIRRKAFLDPVFIFRLIRYCRKNKIEIIHAHQLLECYNAFFAARILRIKIFLTYHGFYYFSKNTFILILGKWLAKRVSANFFVSNFLKGHYIKRYLPDNKNAEVIYNGISIPALHDFDNHSLKKEFKIKEGEIILGMVGNFAAARNHLLICRAYKRLLETHSMSGRLHMVFIGKRDREPSPAFREVYDFCRDSGLLTQVHFTGPRINASLLLHNFDLFVYASHRETFCLSVVEAIIAGIPVLVNDIPVIKEITSDGKYAGLYKTNDPDDLVQKLSDTLLNLVTRKQEAIKMRELAITRYSVQNHIERLTELYRRY